MLSTRAGVRPVTVSGGGAESPGARLQPAPTTSAAKAASAPARQPVVRARATSREVRIVFTVAA
jgi:hypothetical protein